MRHRVDTGASFFVPLAIGTRRCWAKPDTWHINGRSAHAIIDRHFANIGTLDKFGGLKYANDRDHVLW